MKNRRYCVIGLVRGGAFAVLAAALAACAVPSAPPHRHMISAANPHAARAGLAVLRAGGSAVDAAIAAQAVLTLVEPQSSGIGGGGFLLHSRAADGRLDAYDGRETASSALDPAAFRTADGKPRRFRDVARGGLPVGVPGIVRMLALAHADHGRLPWPRLFDAAIRLAREGFPVSPRLHRMIADNPGLADFPAARAYFYDAGGRPLAAGARLRNPALAETLAAIARDGADALYAGPIAADIVASVRGAARNPGAMTLADLAGYRAVRRTALCRPYRGYRVCGMPPPTSGGTTTLQILGLLARFDIGALRPGSTEAVHLISEASRLAFADRGRYLGDPDHVAMPIDGLLDRGYLARRSALISRDRALDQVRPGRPDGAAAFAPARSAPHPSTTHLVAIDDAGNAVSLTSSIERPFGARLMVRGFLLNNQLTDFSWRAAPGRGPVANAVAPGRRPRSSMSPTLIFGPDGRLFAALGSPGGSRIIGYVAQAAIALIDWKLDMQAAIDLPRHVARFGPIELEKGTPITALAESLQARGHEVRVQTLTSGLHGIRVTAAGLDGGADRRREGVALGD